MSSSEGLSTCFVLFFCGPFSVKPHGSLPSIIAKHELADAVYGSVEMAGERVDGMAVGEGWGEFILKIM